MAGQIRRQKGAKEASAHRNFRDANKKRLSYKSTTFGFHFGTRQCAELHNHKQAQYTELNCYWFSVLACAGMET